MRHLINIEDKYGIFDLYAHQMSNIKRISEKKLVKAGEEIFIQRACSSPAVFSLNEQSLQFITEYGISDIIFIFDLDAFNGNADILTYTVIEDKIRKTCELAKHSGAECRFVPVCYMAESIALLNYSDSRLLHVEDYVHYENYKEYIVQLVGCLSGRSPRMVKKFHQYLNIDEMLDKMKETQYEDNPNRYLYSFLTREISVSEILSFTDLPSYFEKVNQLFQEKVDSSKNIKMVIDEDMINLSAAFKDIQIFFSRHKNARCIKFVKT